MDRTAGECWLFHGTNHAKSIIQNGFTTQYSTPEYFTGYGALGKGIYLTDLFSKASIYINCPKCEKNHCGCAPDLAESKVAILSRVTLGRCEVVPLNSFRSKYRHMEAPNEGFNSIWAPDKAFNLLESGFDSNEFCVPEDQVYPEFCIFYKENIFPKSDTNSSLFLSVDSWKNGFKKHFKSIKEPLLLALEKSIADYEGLALLPNREAKQLIFLRTRLEPLIVELRTQSKSPTEHSKISDIHEKWQAEVKRVSPPARELDSGESAQFESKALVNFANERWPQVISSVNKMLSSNSAYLDYFLLLRAKAYLHLKQTNHYIWSLNAAIELSSLRKSPIFETKFREEKSLYFGTSLIGLLNNFEFHSDKAYLTRWFESLIKWLQETRTNNSIEIWKTMYWYLKKHESMLDLNKLLEINDAQLRKHVEILPDENGVRARTVKQNDSWQEKLESVVSCEAKTHVEMSWLKNGQLRKRFLKQKFVDALFQSNGYPRMTGQNHQQTGKKLVVLLREDQSGEPIAYAKFYPDYPLRQQAVDQLCSRLSGFNLVSTLVKLRHARMPDNPYPVIFSEPLGCTLNDSMSSLGSIEDNFDMVNVHHFLKKIQNV